MTDSDAVPSGPLRFLRGPSCLWIVTAPLYLAFCLALYGFGVYCCTAVRHGWWCLLILVPGSYYVYRWGKAFRFWSATFDRTRGVVTARWGLFVPLRVRAYHFAELEALHLGRQRVRAYRNTYVVNHPVSLVLADGRQTALLLYHDFFQARRMAEEAALYAELPVIDASVDPPQFIPADKVGQPLRTTEPKAHVRPTLLPLPAGARCCVVWEGPVAVVHLPVSGRKFVLSASVKGLGVLALLSVAVGAAVWWHTGSLQQALTVMRGTALFGCVPFFLLVQLLWLLVKWRAATTITVDPAGLHYRTRGLLGRSTRHVAHEDLKSIRLDGSALEILTVRKRIRFGDNLTVAERHWLCAALNQLAAG